MDIFEFAELCDELGKDDVALADLYEEEELGFMLDCEEDDYE